MTEPRAFKQVTDLDAVQERLPTFLAIGVFDGVHLGHQSLLRRMVAAARGIGARPTVLTFFPHPVQVIQGLTGRLYLVTLARRLTLLRELGIELVIVHPFDEKVRQMRAREFVAALDRRLDLKELWGGSFTLGYRREGTAEYLPRTGIVPRVEVRGSHSRYHHQEFESSGILGTEFGLLSYHGTAIAHTSQYGPFRKGAVGAWVQYRDFASGGLEFTPASTEWSVAGFGFQDVHFGAFTVQGGVRYDLRRVTPREERTSGTIGDVEARSFGGASASLSGIWHPGEQVSVGANVMRSLRMPGIEELFSEGPHLASYSFEIGNPALGLAHHPQAAPKASSKCPNVLTSRYGDS